MTIVGNYLLGRDPSAVGGHASLYRAVHVDDPSQVYAVKLFKDEERFHSGALRASWTNELETYQRLGEHSHLVKLFDWGKTEEGSPYLVFEWLDGDLMTLAASGAIEGWDDFWPVARDVLSGLSLIHAAGFVHRDVKPENVLVSADGTYKVADFGTTRLIEVLRAGQTMAPLGTVPYAPPERGTPGPSAAYDVYSFVVLAVVCLSGEVPAEKDLRGTLAALDLPESISAVLLPCLEEQADARPESAGVLLAHLTEAQNERERSRTPAIDLHVRISRAALDGAQRLLHVPAADVEQFVRSDMESIRAFGYDSRPGAPLRLQLMGQSLLYKLDVDKRDGSSLVALGVVRPGPQLIEAAQSDWCRPHVRLRWTSPTNKVREAALLQEFLLQVSENDEARAAVQAASFASGAFATWRRALRAKFKVEDERAEAIAFTSWRRDGARVRFKVEALPDGVVGENRLVYRGNRRVLFGEVEEIDNSELVLYVTRGSASELPKSGRLEFDAEASKHKLRREQAALDRLSSGRATRPAVRELLMQPLSSATPRPLDVPSFFQDDLDLPKREAIKTALGSEDFLLVQGPPGTGKTTFIAELVAQELRRNPSTRILLTAQTHVAVDHALAGVARHNPDAQIVRIGRLDQMSEEVEGLSVSARLEEARSHVAEASRQFLREFAQTLGLDIDAADTESLVAELAVRSERLTQLRSRLSHRRNERKILSQQIEEQSSIVPEVLDVAAAVERALSGASASDVADASRLYVELGVKLAGSLESGGSLGDKLIEVQTLLDELSRQLAEEQQVEVRLRSEASAALGLEAGASTESILAKAADRRAAVDDPTYNRLSEIAADWTERYGIGHEFNAVVIAGADVVGATCVGLTGLRGADSVDFDLCIVDEASKATATEVLVPVVQSRRWILVGDDRQLPPFVEEALNKRDILEQFELTRAEVAQTLFSVLAEGLPASAVVQLSHQHRMHPGIGGLISHCFYNDSLTSAERGVDERIKLALGVPVTWVDTSRKDDRHEVASGKSYLNRLELQVARQLLERLNLAAAKDGTTLRVALLTGYDPQRRELVGMVASNEPSLANLEIHVANVDAYQGQEADVAVFCVTRSNDRGDLGFLRQAQRVNVALSRARDALVLIGDASFVRSATSTSNPLAEVLRYIESHPETCTVREEI